MNCRWQRSTKKLKCFTNVWSVCVSVGCRHLTSLLWLFLAVSAGEHNFSTHHHPCTRTCSPKSRIKWRCASDSLSSGCCHQIDVRYQCLVVVGFYHRGRSSTHWTFFETWNSFWFLLAWLAWCRDPHWRCCWDVLFRRVLRNGNHLLYTLLPDKNSHGYNLRHRRHDRILVAYLITTSEIS